MMQQQQFEEQARQQREQQQQQQQRADQQYAEQRAIASAPPPPGPAETADVAQSALETGPAQQQIRQGLGRKKLRKDLAGGVGGLSIPNV
jgi:membrane protein involved in colicin uptake